MVGAVRRRAQGTLNDLDELSTSHPLEALELAAYVREQLEAVENAAVVNARLQEPPATWEEIAAALGVTRQTAHERHASRVARPKEE
jgi:predicted transcriptional regulator